MAIRLGVRANFLEVDFDRRSPGVGGVPRVHIDIGVHVHENAASMCAPAVPHVAGCVAVATRPPERRRRSGAFGRRWERPPKPRAWYGRGPCVFSHAAPALQGSLPIHQSLAGRPSSAGGGGAVRRSAISAPAGGLGGRCPRPPAAPAAARGAGSSKGGAASPRQIAMFNIAWAGSRALNQLVARRWEPWAVRISIPVH